MNTRIATARQLITSGNGRFVSVTFAKRSDGSVRKMVTRTGVGIGLTGGGARYDAVKHNLLPAFDISLGEWRSIPLEGVTEVRVNGQVHNLVEAE